MVTKLQKAKKEPDSIASVLKKVKLPSVAFHVDGWGGDYRVTKLTNLRYKDGSDGTCECDVICGEETITDGGTQHRNVHNVPMKECFSTLVRAQEAIALRKRVRERRVFMDSCDHYGRTNSTKVRLLKQYPDLVLKKLIDEFEIDDETDVTPATLTTSHFRLACKYFDALVSQIADVKFPDLIGNDD